MLRVSKINKIFYDNNGNEIHADKDISFEATNGLVIGILGPNGAGKTTLLRMLGGIMKPTSGEILFDNLNYENNSVEIKKNIAYLSGNTKLYKSITPRELLELCGEIYGVGKEKVIERINELEKEFDMSSFIDKYIETLSTGQTQRVNIARCLIHNPMYYILDEATSGLDIVSSQIILDFIKKEKKKGKTIIYSTHYMEEAENVCDFVFLLDHGSIIESGTASDINKKYKTKNLRDAFFKIIEGVNHE